MNMKKKSLVIIILISVILISVTFGLVTIINNNNQSPYEFLAASKSIYPYPIINPTGLLCQADTGDKECVIFYINERGNAACAIMKKGLFTYNILGTSAEKLLGNGTESADYLFSSYKDGNELRWIEWGVVRDDSIKQVLVDGRTTTFLNTSISGIRICYLLGNGSVFDVRKYEVIY